MAPRIAATPGSAKLGLRERKKAKTEATIRRHAIRLFRRYGYTATTVEQIADAAEIAHSTFFRYFPTKEALLFNDAEEQAIEPFDLVEEAAPANERFVRLGGWIAVVLTPVPARRRYFAHEVVASLEVPPERLEIRRLREDSRDPDDGRDHRHQAEILRQQQARLFWLRAAIDLSRAWAAKGLHERGISPLHEAVSAFSGDDYPVELATARQILSGRSG